MRKKIILIVLGALALAVLIGLLWMWFFGGAGGLGGTFGRGGSATTTPTVGRTVVNVPAKVATSTTKSTVSGGTFGLGAKGPEVAKLQTFLINSGYLTLPATTPLGTFDGFTESALRAYQTTVGVTPNGYFGTSTLLLVNAALGATTTPARTTPSPTTGGGTISNSAGGSATVTTGPAFFSSSTASGPPTGTPTVPGAQWLDTNATLSTFVPSQLNQLDQSSVGGQVAIFGTPPSVNPGNAGGINLGIFAAAGIAGALTCTPGLLGSIAGLVGNVGAAVSVPNAALAVPVSDLGTQANLTTNFAVNNALKGSDTYKTNFLDCITRVIAKVVLQQITNSVVNWINSGFNGQPSFVQNYEQFFNKVADQAAGEFIRGSALSFLCSPFQAQIKLAIARSYAQRNAQSCTFTSVANNFNKFVSGNFSAGGWRGLIQLTTMPTNNPYGAFMYAQGGLTAAQNNATNNKRTDLINGRGFLSFEQKPNCRPAPNPGTGVSSAMICDPPKIVTPGDVISGSINKTLGVGQDSLNMAKNFDEIISALLTQLMSKTLQGGLANLSGTTGYASSFLTPDQQQAQDRGNALIISLQTIVQAAQQYGSVEQGSARDLQSAQQQYLSLQNCWEVASATPTLTTEQQAVAAQNGAAAGTAIASLEAEVALHNNNIVRANAAVGLVQELQTRTLQVTSTADVAAINNAISAAQANGILILGAEVTQAQQDRTSLQTRLGGINQTISVGLQQCNAFGR